MNLFFLKIQGWSKGIQKPGAALKISSFRQEAMPYFIGWIVIFTWLYCYFLPNGNLLFLGKELLTGFERTATYIWLFTCPLITTCFKGVNYVPKTIYSVAAAFVSFICMTFFQFGEGFVLAFQIIIAASVGHIFASCGYGFFMILNNAEKFYSMILGIFLPKLIMFTGPFITQNLKGLSFPELILFSCLLLMLICSVSFSKERAFVPSVGKKPFPKQAWSLMAVVFVVLAFNDVIAPLLLFQMKTNLQRPLDLFYFGGIITGLLFVLLLQKHFKVNIYIMLNQSMALLAVGFVISTVAETYVRAVEVSAVCFGVSYSIGLVNVYYLAGFMAKKFQNITFYRIGIILSATYYFYGFITIHIFKNTLAIISILSVCILIIFLMLSPRFMKLLYEGDWIDDSYRKDVTFESRLRARLKELNLTPKETEVCELLLQGYTMRQAAAMLGLAYATVNAHCTALYRKLGINSRTELTLLFKQYIDK